MQFPIKLTKADFFRYDNTATIAELLVYKVICSLAKGRPCKATDAYIGKQLGINSTSVSRHIQKLDEKNYIHKKRIKTSGTVKVTRQITIVSIGRILKSDPIYKDFKFLIIPAHILSAKIDARKKIILSLIEGFGGEDNFIASKEYVAGLIKMSPKYTRELLLKMGLVQKRVWQKDFDGCESIERVAVKVLDDGCESTGPMAVKVLFDGCESTEGLDRLDKIDYDKIDYDKIAADKIVEMTNSGAPEEMVKKARLLTELSEERKDERFNMAVKLEETLQVLLANLSSDIELDSRSIFYMHILKLINRPRWNASERDMELIGEIQLSLYLDDGHLSLAAERIALDIVSILFVVKTFNFGSVLAGARVLLQKTSAI